MESYKNRVSFDKRKSECERIMCKYTDRIPIIVNRTANCKLPMIDKEKFLVPSDMTLGQFVYVIRKRIKLEPNEALFILVNNTLQPSSAIIVDIYEKLKDKDGFLYIHYSSENTFG
jgi:GABA(A) receptor-associated protein